MIEYLWNLPIPVWMTITGDVSIQELRLYSNRVRFDGVEYDINEIKFVKAYEKHTMWQTLRK